MICSRTWFTSRNSIVCECESLFFTGLETNLVDNDDLFKYKSGGWTGASASQSSPTNIFSPVESTCADHNPSSDTSPPPEHFLLLTPSGRASALCNTDFTFTLEKTVSLYQAVLSDDQSNLMFHCKAQVAVDASTRVPKSYIDAVKPAAFARVLGKAISPTGADIKIRVHTLTFLCKHKYWFELFTTVYCWGLDPSEELGPRERCLWCRGLHWDRQHACRRLHVKILWLVIATAITHVQWS